MTLPLLRLLLLFLLVAVPALIALERDARACTCVPPPPPLTALANSDLVFSGRVTAREAPNSKTPVQSSADPVWYTFGDVRVWKGDAGTQEPIRVETATSSASCGYDFAVGREYLVYCRVKSGRAHTGLCTRTRPLEQAEEDITAFEQLAFTGDPATLHRAIVRAYVEDLRSADPERRQGGIEGLGGCGHRAEDLAIPALVETYGRSPTPENRTAILHAIARIGSPEHGGAEIVSSALQDADPRFRVSALNAAWSVLPVPALRAANDRALQDPDAEVRETAIAFLADWTRRDGTAPFDSTEIVDRILGALNDTSPTVRYRATTCLPRGRARGTETGAALWRARQDPDPETRRAALSGLGEMRPRDEAVQRELIAAIEDPSLASTAVSALRTGGPLLSETLAALARVGRGQAGRDGRGVTDGALDEDGNGNRGDRRGGGERDPYLVNHALQSLYALARENPAACDTMAALWGPALSTRAKMDVLGLLHAASCDPGVRVGVLRQAVRDDDPKVRISAIYRIEGLLPARETDAADLWISALGDRDTAIRVAAAQRLGTVHGDAVLRAIPYLESLAVADSAENVRRVAQYALQQLGAR